MSSLPPQRRQPGGAGGGPGGRAGRTNLTPKEGAEEAERRLNLPCFHAGQKVTGIYACVACQFRINNRGTLPTCPDCGEIVWAYMGGGPRPVPEGEDTAAAPAAAPPPAAAVEEGVKLDAPAPVSVQENVKLQP
jgi:hypothetical protein